MNFPWIAITVFFISIFFAYQEHMNNNPVDSTQAKIESNENLAHSIAAEAMEEQQQCLDETPEDWCNRDITYADHLRVAKYVLREELGGQSSFRGNETRNLCIFFALISGAFIFYYIKEKFS